MAASLNSLTTKECKYFSETHRAPNERAVAGGRLIAQEMRWKEENEMGHPQARAAAPPMPCTPGAARALVPLASIVK